VAALAGRPAVPGLRGGVPALPDARRRRGAFVDDAGTPTLANVRAAAGGPYLDAFVRSLQLSAITAVTGAVFGALLAWAVVTGSPTARCAGSSRRRPGCSRSSAA
jgi:hypothetical protein